MNQKPVFLRANSGRVLALDSEEFGAKLLCDKLVLNPGDSCVYSCTFCYTESCARKFVFKTIQDANTTRKQVDPSCADLKYQDVVIRRPNAVEILRGQLTKKDGSSRFVDLGDNRVVFSSTLVDVAANYTLLTETAELCNLIFEKTSWHIRLLSKSNALHLLFERKLISDRFRDRIILGVSTGTLNDGLAQAIEIGTPLVSKRLDSLHWLQTRGFRTFGMICPSLPQLDYAKFSKEICAAINSHACEHVWAEVINVRGSSLSKTFNALTTAGFKDEAEMLKEVSENRVKWEEYARETFLAHMNIVPGEKLRFLQYVTPATLPWWQQHASKGAVILGKAAKVVPSLR